jgi:hypothetical protein
MTEEGVRIVSQSLSGATWAQNEMSFGRRKDHDLLGDPHRGGKTAQI